MADDSGLFRPQAIEAARIRPSGPTHNSGVPTWIIVAFMTAVFFTAVLFMATARYTKKETVVGQVVPAEGVLKVTAARAGIVRDVRVQSGQLVAKDQPLIIFSYDAVLEGGEVLSSGVNQAAEEQIRANEEEARSKASQTYQEQMARRADLEAVKRSIPILEEQRKLQAERIVTFKKDYEVFQELFAKGYVGRIQVSNRLDALLQGQQRLLEIESSIRQQTSQAAQIRAQLAGTEYALRAAQANLRGDQLALKERRLANLAEQGAQVVAARSGRITSLQVQAGDPVVPGQTLALIVPKGDRELQKVVLWVPSRSIGFVEPGARVRLMFDAFPYQTFGVAIGRVGDISLAPILPADVPVPVESKEQVYKVIVSLDRNSLDGYGRSWPLRAGMRLKADLVLDKKSLLAWLLEPVTAMRRREAA
jgi:membrane fusion protein